MTTFKQALAADVASVFMNASEFGELAVYLSPAGVSTANVGVVVALQSFIQEFTNIAGMGATIVISRANLSSVEIHGKITVTDGTFIIQQIISKDADTFTCSCLGDARISPSGMRQ